VGGGVPRFDAGDRDDVP